jgi:tetratricopeptide (TPR) repeat protein
LVTSRARLHLHEEWLFPTELQTLVDHSWLRVHAGRFALHELMRQYCAEKLNHEHLAETAEAVEAVQGRHVAYFAGITGAKEPTLNWHCESMSLLKPDYANLDVAWQWALAHDDLAAARQMVNSLYYVADMTGWFSAMLPFFENATTTLRRRRQEGTLSPTQAQATLLLLSNILYIRLTLYQRLGWLTRTQACLEEMQSVLDTAVEDALWLDQHFMARWATICLTFARGDFATVLAAAQTELTYLQTTDLYCYPWSAEIGTRFWQAHVLAMLASTSTCLGDFPAALAYYRQAISLRDDMGEQRYKAVNLRALAAVQRIIGAHEEAMSTACSALALSQSFDDRLNVAYAELTVAQIEADRGRYSVAMERCRHSLAVGQESGEHALLMRSLIELARIELALDRPVAARHWLEEAITAFVQTGEPHSNHLAFVYLGLGQVAAAKHDWNRSRQMLCQALATPGCSAAERQAVQATLDRVDCVSITFVSSAQPNHPRV